MYFIKLFRKVLYSIFTNKYHILLIFVVVMLIVYCSHIGEILNKVIVEKNKNMNLFDYKIDVVYTWVNGTDEKFKENMLKYLNKDVQKSADYSQERYDDKYELKFSLRSLEKYAPWVNHVWIVTNGQIPYWLNLDYEKVTIIDHKDIFPDVESTLPTFSSPAIETNIHRINGLSSQFLYLNDDTFFGAPVYPSDFISPDRGFLVYLAWPLPACANSCPWLYVADGQCDSACYTQQCQFDGGDCDRDNRLHSNNILSDHHDYETEDRDNIEYEYFEENHNFLKRELLHSLNDENETHNNKILLGYVEITKNDSSINKNYISMTTGLKTNRIKSKLLKNSTDLLNFVKYHNQNFILNDKIKRKKRLFKTLKTRKKYYKNVFNNTSKIQNNLTEQNLDTYALSLQHTNRIFNLNYGYIQRKVPAHAPILIDVKIMNDLQIKFENEIKQTQKNRFRSPNDFQYSFSYYYYLMNEKIRINMSQIFDEFDTDHSGTWSDREIRTILTKINELPLNYGMVESFDNAIINCSHYVKVPQVEVPPYERYQDSKLPTVSKQLVINCPKIAHLLESKFAVRNKYKYEVIKNAQGQYVMFKMLTSNISDVVGHLDEIRKEPRKFVCLNDNMNSKKSEDNDLVKAILLDMYLALFPKPSKFELPQEYRNRFAYMSDLRKWKEQHTKINVVLVVSIMLLAIVTAHNICKRRFARQFNKIIYF